MSKFKKRGKQNKITPDTIRDKSRGRHCDQYPSFSFRYLTTNNNYNFNYFKSSDKNDRVNGLSSLMERLAEITSQPFTHWLGLPKDKGCETIEYSFFRSLEPNHLKLAKDDKIYVFRFHKQGYRIIGVKVDSCPIIHLMGFDFDHSSYNHGS